MIPGYSKESAADLTDSFCYTRAYSPSWESEGESVVCSQLHFLNLLFSLDQLQLAGKVHNYYSYSQSVEFVKYCQIVWQPEKAW